MANREMDGREYLFRLGEQKRIVAYSFALLSHLRLGTDEKLVFSTLPFEENLDVNEPTLLHSALQLLSNVSLTAQGTLNSQEIVDLLGNTRRQLRFAALCSICLFDKIVLGFSDKAWQKKTVIRSGSVLVDESQLTSLLGWLIKETDIPLALSALQELNSAVEPQLDKRPSVRPRLQGWATRIQWSVNPHNWRTQYGRHWKRFLIHAKDPGNRERSRSKAGTNDECIVSDFFSARKLDYFFSFIDESKYSRRPYHVLPKKKLARLWRQCCKKYHPDKTGDPDSAEIFIAFEEAFKALENLYVFTPSKDELEQRKICDLYIDDRICLRGSTIRAFYENIKLSFIRRQRVVRRPQPSPYEFDSTTLVPHQSQNKMVQFDDLSTEENLHEIVVGCRLDLLKILDWLPRLLACLLGIHILNIFLTTVRSYSEELKQRKICDLYINDRICLRGFTIKAFYEDMKYSFIKRQRAVGQPQPSPHEFDSTALVPHQSQNKMVQFDDLSTTENPHEIVVGCRLDLVVISDWLLSLRPCLPRNQILNALLTIERSYSQEVRLFSWKEYGRPYLRNMFERSDSSCFFRRKKIASKEEHPESITKESTQIHNNSQLQLWVP